MKKVMNHLLVIVICAAIAAWLKMCVPRLSIAYGIHDSLRNKSGLVMAMPLYEMYYLGWIYLIFMAIIVIINKLIIRLNSYRTSAFTGFLIGSTLYLLNKLYSYMNNSYIYSNHSMDGGKPWYFWIEIPQDLQLLLIYSITGLIGGLLYYRWIALIQQ